MPPRPVCGCKGTTFFLNDKRHDGFFYFFFCQEGFSGAIMRRHRTKTRTKALTQKGEANEHGRKKKTAHNKRSGAIMRRHRTKTRAQALEKHTETRQGEQTSTDETGKNTDSKTERQTAKEATRKKTRKHENRTAHDKRSGAIMRRHRTKTRTKTQNKDTNTDTGKGTLVRKRGRSLRLCIL